MCIVQSLYSEQQGTGGLYVEMQRLRHAPCHAYRYHHAPEPAVYGRPEGSERLGESRDGILQLRPSQKIGEYVHWRVDSNSLDRRNRKYEVQQLPHS